MTNFVSAVVVRSARNLLILFHLLPSWGPPTAAGYRPAPGFVIPKPPEIKLTMYSEVDSIEGVSSVNKFPDQTGAFENDFVFKNGSDYVLYEGTESAAFACEADYPITWKPPLSSGNSVNPQFVHIFEFRISELTPALAAPENKRYIVFIYVVTSTANFVSVGLTCSSVEVTPAQETTIHLYRMGKEVIENEGKTATVYATPPDAAPFKDLPPLVIPCRPSSPNLPISLEKQISVPSENQPHKMDTLWSPVKPSGTEVTFDPQIGFTIQRTHLGNSIFGLYRCFVTSNEEGSPDEDNLDPSTAQVALVNVVRDTAPNNQSIPPAGGVIPFAEKMVVGGKASFTFSPGSNGVNFGTVKCCTGKVGKPPTLLLQYCNNPIKCRWNRESLSHDEAPTTAIKQHVSRIRRPVLRKLPSDCGQKILSSMSMVIRCTGDDVDVLQEYVPLFTPDAGGPIANRSQKSQSVRKRKPIGRGKLMPVPTEFVQLYEYVKASAAENVEASRKMLIFVGNVFETPQPRKRAVTSNSVVSNLNTLSTLYGGGEGSPVTARLKALHFYEYDRDVLFSGEPLNFMCVGIHNFYARGVHMRVNWKNGTKTGISTNSTLEGSAQDLILLAIYLTNNALLPRGTGEGVSVAVGEAVIAREEMDSVECFLPVAGSSRWDQLSKEVQVVPSVTPQFVEGEEEDVYLYVGEVNRTVSCTLKEGAPFPEIKVYRDGQPMGITIPAKSGSGNQTRGQRQKNTRARATETLDRVKMVGRVSIKFDVVTHSNQNVFQCNATNIRGVATRTIRVFVLDKPNRTVPIILGVLVILGVTLVGLGVKHWLNKRRGP